MFRDYYLMFLRDAAEALSGGNGGNNQQQQQQAPPAAPAAPWGDGSQPWKVGEGDAAKAWYEFLPEGSTRDIIKGKNYATPAAVAEAYANAQKLISGSSDVFVVPGKDAKPEDWDKVNKALGRPDTPDGYKFEYPNGFTPDPAMENFGKNLLHKMGVPASKATDAMTMWNGFVEETNRKAQEASVAANEQQVTALRQELGDQFDTHIAAGRRVVDALGLSKEEIAAIEGNIGAAPIIKLLAKIGMKSGELSFVPNDGKKTGEWATKSDAEIDAEITRLNSDADYQKAYTDENHPGNKDAKEKMRQLFEAKFAKTNPK